MSQVCCQALTQGTGAFPSISRSFGAPRAPNQPSEGFKGSSSRKMRWSAGNFLLCSFQPVLEIKIYTQSLFPFSHEIPSIPSFPSPHVLVALDRSKVVTEVPDPSGVRWGTGAGGLIFGDLWWRPKAVAFGRGTGGTGGAGSLWDHSPVPVRSCPVPVRPRSSPSPVLFYPSPSPVHSQSSLVLVHPQSTPTSSPLPVPSQCCPVPVRSQPAPQFHPVLS